MGVGDPLGFKPHMAIEKYGKFKEDYHLRFRWTPRKLIDLAIWGFAVPIGIFYLVRKEQMIVEKANGRPGKPEEYFG